MDEQTKIYHLEVLALHEDRGMESYMDNAYAELLNGVNDERAYREKGYVYQIYPLASVILAGRADEEKVNELRKRTDLPYPLDVFAVQAALQEGFRWVRTETLEDSSKWAILEKEVASRAEKENWKEWDKDKVEETR